ncbi:PhoH-like ATPase [Malonomonas rubra DSM 5091]|uniref:PhoH-like ATPase n=1 Tax=Malonomonas rubra DSM 5091 TaxID=1122189 RepID=A0A1M6H5F2_MALRU|nr:PhoH family protein [Malonomonas rubra]SHJ17396.1 PhoH-like ATPase [Malonomonas rubra DSM 5091]
MSEKKYLLDTNVLLHDAHSLHNFADNQVILPLAVIEELDRFKKDANENGRNARQVSRTLDRLRLQGVLTNGGVSLENGGLLRVVVSKSNNLKLLPPELRQYTVDHQILALALEEQQRSEEPVILVSKDINLRIKAHAVGLQAQDYETDKISLETLYTGVEQRSFSQEQIDRFFRDQCLHELEEDFPPHLCLKLDALENPQQQAIARYDQQQRALLPLRPLPVEGYWGITPRNVEQKFALELLSHPDIHLVTLVGRAGTGKTLLALAAGLQAVTEANQYSRLLVSRPVFPMGRDLGFLPGDVEEKLAPWMQPINDNLDLLLNQHDNGRRGKQRHQELKDLDIISVEPLTYIRGRSIPRQYMIVDEAQNLTPHEVKTIISRAGEGTKIVLTGDPEQIDNPYVDSSSNGLTYVVERFRNNPLSGHIMLTRGERSPLADAASELL